jgi:hypothetical protein
VETLTGLFLDLETFDNLEIKDASLEPILKNGTARRVTFEKDEQQPPKSNNDTLFDWKGQKDLNTSQVGFLLRKFPKAASSVIQIHMNSSHAQPSRKSFQSSELRRPMALPWVLLAKPQAALL